MTTPPPVRAPAREMAGAALVLLACLLLIFSTPFFAAQAPPG